MRKLILFYAFVFLSGGAMAGKTPVAIFHAFNEPYSVTMGKLDDIARKGYSHLQIGPPNSSVNNTRGAPWHIMYQPQDLLDFNNAYGSESELRSLVAAAKGKGLEVIADVVLNHLGETEKNGKVVKRGQFQSTESACGCEAIKRIFSDVPGCSGEVVKTCQPFLENLLLMGRFKGYSMAQCSDDPTKKSKFLSGDMETIKTCMRDFKHPLNRNPLGALTHLDNSSPNVREKAFAFLQKLKDVGITGFRFDMVGSILPQSALKDYYDFVKDAGYSYLEDLGRLVTEFSAPVVDGHYSWQVLGSCLFQGKLNKDCLSFSNPSGRKGNDVTNADTHDMWAYRTDGGQTGTPSVFSDPDDIKLANHFILARYQGVPLILNVGANADGIGAGVMFRKLMFPAGGDLMSVPAGAENIDTDKNLLIVKRNNGDGVALINTGTDEMTFNLSDKGLSGAYKVIDDNGGTTPLGDTVVKVPSRRSVFLVKDTVQNRS